MDLAFGISIKEVIVETRMCAFCDVDVAMWVLIISLSLGRRG